MFELVWIGLGLPKVSLVVPLKWGNGAVCAPMLTVLEDGNIPAEEEVWTEVLLNIPADVDTSNIFLPDAAPPKNPVKYN